MMPLQWPDLPNEGFIAGRTAAKEDMVAGRAVFYVGEIDFDPMPIEIPQYAYWIDEMGGKHPMILVQAEQHRDGTTIIGLRSSDGSEIVATFPEIELLGRDKPPA